MQPILLLCLTVSVVLSAAAQIFLKIAMSQPATQLLLATPERAPLKAILTAVVHTPVVYVGLLLYLLSMVVWLFVLSKIDVSSAYPFVALGIIFTTIGGHFILGEHISAMRFLGCLVIALGIGIVAKS